MKGKVDELLAALERNFRLELFLNMLDDLKQTCLHNAADLRHANIRKELAAALEEVFDRMKEQLSLLFAPGVDRKSDFFRDLAGSVYMNQAGQVNYRNREPASGRGPGGNLPAGAGSRNERAG